MLKRALVIIIAGLCTFANAQSPQEQDKGTDLAPWVQVVLVPMLEQSLQSSLSLIYTQGMSMTTVQRSSLIFSLEAQRPSDEERNNLQAMSIRNPFTIRVNSCGTVDGAAETDMWDSKINNISIRSKRNSENLLSEGVRELTLLTNSDLTNVSGVADTFQTENGSKGTRIVWQDDINNRQYALVFWENFETGDVWITYHLTATTACQ